MQSFSDSFPDIQDKELQIPLSRIDLMVTFHMLRTRFPSLSLMVRNQAMIQQKTHNLMDIDLASEVISALCTLKLPESNELKKTLSKLLHRWISTEKILQDIMLSNGQH